MGVSSLPKKTVTRQRRDFDLNPGPSAPESSTLTTRLPSHLHTVTRELSNAVCADSSRRGGRRGRRSSEGRERASRSACHVDRLHGGIRRRQAVDERAGHGRRHQRLPGPRVAAEARHRRAAAGGVASLLARRRRRRSVGRTGPVVADPRDRRQLAVTRRRQRVPSTIRHCQSGRGNSSPTALVVRAERSAGCVCVSVYQDNNFSTR